jgi:hypothetical protein
LLSFFPDLQRVVHSQSSERPVVWEGLQELLLAVTKFYHSQVFDVGEYWEDLKKHTERYKQEGFLNPYERLHLKLFKHPDNAVRLTKLVLYIQVLYYLVKAAVRFVFNVFALCSYLASLFF